MSDKYPEIPRLRPVSLTEYFNIIYPIPKERREDAKDAAFKVGDIVEIFAGPAQGRLGVVVVDMNKNYVDYEPYVNDVSIGVNTIEPTKSSNSILQAMISDGIIDSGVTFETATRWFDDPVHLQLLFRECE